MTRKIAIAGKVAVKARKAYRRGTATRETIIRTAERMFAASGIDGVSIRDITAEAGVDLSMINYHFGSKDGLFEAVINARNREVTLDRERRLAALSPCFVLEDVVDAFFVPLQLRIDSNDNGWRHYAEIVVQIAYTNRYSHFRHRIFDDIAERFVDCFASIYPDVDRGILYWSYFFMAGSLGQILAGSDRLYRLTHGACDARDVEEAFAEMRSFTVHGIRGRIAEKTRSKASA